MTKSVRILLNIACNAPGTRPTSFFHAIGIQILHRGVGNALVPVAILALDNIIPTALHTTLPHSTIQSCSMTPVAILVNVHQFRIDSTMLDIALLCIMGKSARILFDIGCHTPAGAFCINTDKAHFRLRCIGIGRGIILGPGVTHFLDGTHWDILATALAEIVLTTVEVAYKLFEFGHGVAQLPAPHVTAEIGQPAITIGQRDPVCQARLCRRIIPSTVRLHIVCDFRQQDRKFRLVAIALQQDRNGKQCRIGIGCAKHVQVFGRTLESRGIDVKRLEDFGLGLLLGLLDRHSFAGHQVVHAIEF